jgi:hypothetical protein
MSTIDGKRQIFGQIAAFRTSCEGFPNLDLTDSFGSVCNGTNSLDFLLDLVKVTVGYEQLVKITGDVFTFELPKIEEEVKKVLKRELKKLVSCGINPSIPDFFKHQNINPLATGIDLDLRKVDYMGVMLIDPSSSAGLLTYDDPSGGLSSTDFNTYLFQTVQLDGTQTEWGSQVFGPPNDILSIEFNSSGPPNNILNIRASEYYSDPVNGKKLTDLNNDYIDSISLFSSEITLNGVIDSLFGSVSFEVNKTKEQIKKEVEVEEIIECILSVDEDIIVDDTFFDFDNESIRRQEEAITTRSNGIRVLKNCGNVESSIAPQILTAATQSIKTATTQADKSQAVSQALENIAAESSGEVSSKNKVTAELDFVNSAIKKLMVKLGNIILGPKVMTIFAVNHYIIHGVPLDDPLDWMKRNKGLLQSILNSIRDAIVKILLEVVLKEIKEIVKCVAIKLATEYAKNQSAQLASLVGVPPDVLRIILGLGGSAIQSPLFAGLVSGQKVTGFGCNTGDCDG